MPKSKTTIKKRSTRNKHCDDPATYAGLKEWYKSTFEKLGWIILAKSKGYMQDKVDSYKKGVYRLQDKLECKINEMQDPDKKIDLQIMIKNIGVLIDHINRDVL